MSKLVRRSKTLNWNLPVWIAPNGHLSQRWRPDVLPVELGRPIAPTASYINRIPTGANPADLAVQLTRFSFMINLKSAEELDRTSPPGILDAADEVIE
jgi:hypothetical protein